MSYIKAPYMQSYSPRARVKVRDTSTFEETYDLTDELISLSTDKAYGRCSGGWSLSLPYRQWQSFGETVTYFDILKPDTVVTIEIDPGDGTGYKPVILGLVDRVAMQWQASPVPHRQISVNGRDFGKILEKHHIGWSPTVVSQGVPDTAGNSQAWVSFQRQLALQAGTAEYLVKQLLAWTKTDLKIYAERIYGVYNTTDAQVAFAPQIAGMMDESAWDAMKNLAHEPFNMLTTDTDPNDVTKFQVILEDQPIYDNGKLARWDDYKIHQIEEQEIISHDLGVSDAERVNVLSYQTPVSTLMVNGAGALISVASPAMTRVATDSDNATDIHGYCARIEKDSFCDPGDEQAKNHGVTVFDSYEASVKRLWNWRKDNHKLVSGTMQVHIRPDIRAGHCIIAKNYGTNTYNEYLVEQVSHQCAWNPVPQFMTTLHLTRGQITTPLKIEQATK